MLYRSTEWGTGAKIGLATSANGITWAKNAGNPVISPAVGSWEAGGTGIDPAGIMKIGATYYLWMNNVGIIPRQTGLLTSTDLVNWSRDANNPIFTGGRYCTAPIKHGTYYYMFVPYTPAGSPVTYPLNGRIEVYRDTNPTFYAADRSYLGYVLLAGAQGAWDSTYLDTPSILTTDITRDTTPTGTTIQMYYSGRVSVSTFTTGLATGTFSELEKLVPQVCPE